jgi:phage-related protein
VSLWRWPMDVGTNKKTRFRVEKIQFGDGYAQRVENGINHEERVLNIKSTLTNAEFLEAEQLLLAHRGSVPIDFLDPKTNMPFKAVVEEWDVSYDQEWVVLTFQAERVFSWP